MPTFRIVYAADGWEITTVEAPTKEQALDRFLDRIEAIQETDTGTCKNCGAVLDNDEDGLCDICSI